MRKLVISPVDRSTSQKLIRQYLHNHYQPRVKEYTFGDHVIRESEMEEYVKAVYFRVKVFGPYQEIVNDFLKDRMITEHFTVPAINSLVVEELIPHPRRLFETCVHCIRLDTGETTQVDLTRAHLKGIRTNTAELVMQSESGWEWFLFDLIDGSTRPVYTGGNEYYLSADGNLFFPVESWSKITVVDLVTGETLDSKNKRHFSRYATRVKIIRVIHFDSIRPCLFVLLMKQQDLSFGSLKKEVCIQLTVTD